VGVAVVNDDGKLELAGFAHMSRNFLFWSVRGECS
jgi:hypothetical protein